MFTAERLYKYYSRDKCVGQVYIDDHMNTQAALIFNLNKELDVLFSPCYNHLDHLFSPAQILIYTVEYFLQGLARATGLQISVH